MKTEYKWLLIIIASFAVATGAAYLIHRHIQNKDKDNVSAKKALYDYDDDDYDDDDDYYYDEEDDYYDDDDEAYSGYYDVSDVLTYWQNKCPMEMGNGITLTSVYLSYQDIIFEYVFDEDVLGVNVSELNDPDTKDICKQQALEALQADQSYENTRQMAALKNAGCNLIYRYYGSNTYDRVDIKIYSYEL